MEGERGDNWPGGHPGKGRGRDKWPGYTNEGVPGGGEDGDSGSSTITGTGRERNFKLRVYFLSRVDLFTGVFGRAGPSG